MIGFMSVAKLAAPLCLLQASLMGLVSGSAIPATGFLEAVIEGDFAQGNIFCASINDGSKKAGDLRDSGSYYANMRNTCQRRTIFKFEEVEGGYVIQAVDIRTALAPIANNWYLAVHDDLESDDAGNGDLRVSLHEGLENASHWDFLEFEGKTAMFVSANRSPDGAGLGCFLSLASDPVRGNESFYLAVTLHADKVLTVNPIAELPANV